MRSLAAVVTLILFTLLTPSSRVQGQDKPTGEKQKIEALIQHVEELKDAKFVRNDAEYDAKAAATFLRRKWKSNEAEIKTAKDFIDKAAWVSSTSGKPYTIRFKGGKEMKSGEYLHAELKKLEKSSDKGEQLKKQFVAQASSFVDE